MIQAAIPFPQIDPVAIAIGPETSMLAWSDPAYPGLDDADCLVLVDRSSRRADRRDEEAWPGHWQRFLLFFLKKNILLNNLFPKQSGNQSKVSFFLPIYSNFLDFLEIHQLEIFSFQKITIINDNKSNQFFWNLK